MSFGGTRALVMIPALPLIMSDLCKTFSLSACFLICKMETIHLPRGIAMRTASSQETELLCHMQLIKRAEGQFLPPSPGLHLVGRGGDWNIERKHSPSFHFSQASNCSSSDSLRGITNIFLVTGLGFSPTFRSF